MKAVINIDLEDEKLQDYSCSDIEKMIGYEAITIQVPLPSVNVSGSYLDLVSDYLDASFLLENISCVAEISAVEKRWDVKNYPVYLLKLEGFDKSMLSEKIKKYIWVLQCPENSEYESDAFNVREEVYEFEENLENIVLKFPEVIDSYHANLVNGAYYEMEYESIEKELAKKTERKYGFWSAACCNGAPVEKAFFSSNAWIVPKSISLESFFSDNDYEGQLSFVPAHLFSVGGISYALSETSIIHFSLDSVLQAVACIDALSDEGGQYRQRLSSSLALFGFSPGFNAFRGGRHTYCSSDDDYKAYVSEFADFVVVATLTANIVIFDVSKVGKDESQKLIAAASQLISFVEDEFVISSDVSFDWEGINDETFEQIAYDIIYHSSKFDRNTIRKMGRSRSRDGGRDIVVWTKSILGEKPKKYIFQCKVSGREQSVSTTNIGSISDVIDQYGADGYGVMCNCYIDSTLYDRLDGISDNRNVDIETWSAFEVERFLSRRPVLKQRYFS